MSTYESFEEEDPATPYSDSEESLTEQDSSTAASGGEGLQFDQIPVSRFDDIGSYLDLLGDKKMKNLTKTIEMIRDCLMMYEKTSTFQSHLVTACSDLTRIIKRTKVTSDITGSCQLISLLQITFYDDLEVYSMCYDSLFSLLKTSKSQPVVTALMHVCTVILFVSDVPDEVVAEFLDYLISLLSSPKPATYPSVAKAIDCWVMLKSIQTKSMVLNSTLPEFASLITACLEISDMPIRIASSRCLVFIKELMKDSPSFTPVSPLDQISENIRNALNEYNRYWKGSRDKNDKKMIREIAQSCDSTCHPDMELHFGNVVLSIDHWGGVIAYNMLYQTIGKGFSYHIRLNPLLKQVFAQYWSAVDMNDRNLFQSKSEISAQKKQNIHNMRNAYRTKMQTYESMCIYDD